MIAAINCYGVVAYKILPGAADHESYQIFLRHLLAPTIIPEQERNTYVFMDGVPFHKNQEVKQIISNAGGIYIYLPGYSPKYNPIELMFAWIKAWLKRHPRISSMYPQLSIILAMRQIPQHYFAAWVQHCGYQFL